jgi:hypothetical protein
MSSEPILEEPVGAFHKGETYARLTRSVTESARGRRKVSYTVCVSAHAELNLNGSYLIQLELDRKEIDRLFYLMNGDRALPELLETFAGFKAFDVVGLSKKS